MGLKEKIAQKVAEQTAGYIDKAYLLIELKKEWKSRLPKEFDVEEETVKAMARVYNSGQKKLFEIVKVTKEDIQKVLEEIRNGE